MKQTTWVTVDNLMFSREHWLEFMGMKRPWYLIALDMVLLRGM